MSIGACPRCQQSSIFQGLLGFKDSCTSCHLPLANRDIGDGAVFLVITFIGFLITLMSAVVELKYTPPLWVHAALWFPLTIVLSLAGLRFARAFTLLIIYRQEVKHKTSDTPL
jgi:uncharacterized protein (DUF983 family)